MDGFILLDRREIPCTEREMLMLATITPVLQKMGLSLFCVRCHAMGNKDGVRTQNHEGDATWTVECGCAVRTWRRHAPSVQTN